MWVANLPRYLNRSRKETCLWSLRDASADSPGPILGRKNRNLTRHFGSTLGVTARIHAVSIHRNLCKNLKRSCSVGSHAPSKSSWFDDTCSQLSQQQVPSDLSLLPCCALTSSPCYLRCTHRCKSSLHGKRPCLGNIAWMFWNFCGGVLPKQGETFSGETICSAGWLQCSSWPRKSRELSLLDVSFSLWGIFENAFFWNPHLWVLEPFVMPSQEGWVAWCIPCIISPWHWPEELQADGHVGGSVFHGLCQQPRHSGNDVWGSGDVRRQACWRQWCSWEPWPAHVLPPPPFLHLWLQFSVSLQWLSTNLFQIEPDRSR